MEEGKTGLSGAARVLAWAMCGLTLGATGATLVMLIEPVRLRPDALPELLSDVFYVLSAAPTAALGLLVVERRPRNALGWIFLVIGFTLAMSGLAQRYAAVMPIGGPGNWPGGLAAWLSQWMWLLPFLGLVLMLLLYPTGHALSPRWRALLWVALLVYPVWMLVAALSTPITVVRPVGYPVEIANPIGVFPAALFDSPLSFVGLMVPLVGGVAAMGVRAWRARGVERQQIKWFLYAAGIFVAANVVSFGLNNRWFAALTNAIPLAIPAAVGIAILRYRLWDIDVIIRRTVTYAVVTALLLVVYFGSVIVLQQLFAGLTGAGQNELVTVLSTLAIAALFVPVRNRVQGVIDRRFNRRQYDAQRVLAEFAQTVRDETDLERLTGRLVEVVSETMQPRSVELWLAGRRQTRSDER